MWLRLKSPAPRLFTQPFIQGADQIKHQSSASLAFCAWNSPVTGEFRHKWPVTRKMFSLDDVILITENYESLTCILLCLCWMNHCLSLSYAESVSIKARCWPISIHNVKIYIWNYFSCLIDGRDKHLYSTKIIMTHEMEAFSALLALCQGTTHQRCIPLTKGQ